MAANDELNVLHEFDYICTVLAQSPYSLMFTRRLAYPYRFVLIGCCSAL